MIRAIVACDKNYGIGKNGTIPWNHKDDMRFFKMATVGHGNNTIIMGRNTKESLPVFPLPERRNYVISSNGEEYFNSFEDFIEWTKTPKEFEDSDIYIIGGASIYNQSFEQRIPQEIYLTLFDEDFECDTFINFNVLEDNYKIQDSRRIEDYTFQVWERK